MTGAASATVCVLEIAALRPDWTTARLREQLAGLDVPVTVIGEMAGYPAVLIEVDGQGAALVCERITTSSHGIEVVELRRHVRPDRLEPALLDGLVAECAHDGRVAVGAAAVERAMQRGRLELLILASGLAESYAEMVRAVIDNNAYSGPLIVSDLNRDELGPTAGVRRAGCIGLLRGRRHVAV